MGGGRGGGECVNKNRSETPETAELVEEDMKTPYVSTFNRTAALKKNTQKNNQKRNIRYKQEASGNFRDEKWKI